MNTGGASGPHRDSLSVIKAWHYASTHVTQNLGDSQILARAAEQMPIASIALIRAKNMRALYTSKLASSGLERQVRCLLHSG